LLEGLPTAVTELLRGAFLQEEYRSRFGFPLVTAETLNELSKLLAGKRVLDAGSGTGFLSHALSERGISVFAVDDESADYGFSTVFRRDATVDAPNFLPEEFDAVILSWPCRATDFAYRVASSMRPGTTLVYEGEGPGAATAGDDFFRLTGQWPRQSSANAALNSGHMRFPGLNDRWDVMTKPPC
jgi:SAM-dependent methyltransferase